MNFKLRDLRTIRRQWSYLILHIFRFVICIHNSHDLKQNQDKFTIYTISSGIEFFHSKSPFWTWRWSIWLISFVFVRLHTQGVKLHALWHTKTVQECSSTRSKYRGPDKTWQMCQLCDAFERSTSVCNILRIGFFFNFSEYPGAFVQAYHHYRWMRWV